MAADGYSSRTGASLQPGHDVCLGQPAGPGRGLADAVPLDPASASRRCQNPALRPGRFLHIRLEWTTCTTGDVMLRDPTRAALTLTRQHTV